MKPFAFGTLVSFLCGCDEMRTVRIIGAVHNYHTRCCNRWYGITEFGATEIEPPDGTGIDAAGNPYPPKERT